MRGLLLGLVISVFSTACGFFGISDDVLIRWPEGGLPIYNGSDPSSWEVHWLNSGGTVSRRVVESAQGALFLELPKESSLIVMAIPITSEYAGPYRVRPAGAVVGADFPLPKSLQLAWEDGFSAQLLLHLVDSGIPSHAINQRRFAETARERSGNRPWLLNERYLRNEIARGKLRNHSFRLLETFEVKLALPEGTWYSQFPPESPLISHQDGWKGVLPIGIWHFARPSDKEVATVSIDDRGQASLQIGN